MKPLSVLPVLVSLVFLTKTLACGLHHRTLDDIVPQYAPIPKSAEGLKLGPGVMQLNPLAREHTWLQRVPTKVGYSSFDLETY
jgi:hypothetical protein